MIDGLSEEAELRLKVVVDGLNDVRRMVGTDIEDAGRTGSRGLRELDRTLSKVTTTIKKLQGDAAGMGDAVDKAGSRAQGAWASALKELADLRKAYSSFQQDMVTGESTEGARPFGDFSGEEIQRAKSIYEASNADIISEIKRREAAEEKAHSQRVAQDRIYNQLLAEQRAYVERSANESIANIQRESAARTAAYSKAAQEATELAAAEAAARDGKRYAGGWSQIGKGTANARNSAALNNRPSAFMKAEAQRGYEAQETREYISQMKSRIDAENKAYAAQEALAGASGRSTDSLITERYALYDVASTTGVLGASLLALVTAYEAVAISRQAAFADVRRTAGFNEDTGEIDQLEDVKKDLERMTRRMPFSFEELSGTAAIGGQLGLDDDELAKFTAAITKFSAVSGIAAETSAEKLGKLVNILGLTTDGYELLARSISFAAAEGAASDEQILAVAAEIAPFATQMNFAATETVGLAAALAALQVPPERARGAFQELARGIDLAVTNGGEKLENFARIAGMSADEFSTTWRNDPMAAFQAFIGGFRSVDNATGALQDLGLNGERVQPVILSLANGFDILTASVDDAKAGVSNGFLDASFGVMADTVAAKLRLLVNALAELADKVGGPVLAPLGVLVSFLTRTLNVISDILDSPIGPFFSALVTVLLVVAGTFALLIAGAAGAGASILAMQTALKGLNGQLPPALAYLANLAGRFVGVNVTARAAATGVNTTTTATRGLRVAVMSLLGATGVGLLITVLGSFAAEAMGLASTEDELTDAMDETNDSAATQAERMTQNAAAMREAVDAANALINAQSGMEGSLFSLGQSIQENGRSFSAFSTGGRSNIQALASTISALTARAGGDAQLLANLLLGLEQQLVSAGAGSEAIDMVRNAMEATGVSATKALVSSNSLAVGISHIDKNSKKAKDSLDDLKEEFRTVGDYAKDLGSILDRAFEIEFGPQAAEDRILSIYSRMRKDAKDAERAVTDLRNEIRETEADLAMIAGQRQGQEYMLSIATQYGDTVRSAQIAGEIARLDAEEATGKTKIVGLNSDLVEAQDAMSTSLTGNTDAAIRNRETMRELIQAQGDYAAALAASGAPQAQIAAALAGNIGLMRDQLDSLGFNRDEINNLYVPALLGMEQVIRDFDRVVTIEIGGLSAAEAALREFLERAKAANRDAAGAMADDFSDGAGAAADSFDQIPAAADQASDGVSDAAKAGAGDLIDMFITAGYAVYQTFDNLAKSAAALARAATTGDWSNWGHTWTYDFDKNRQVMSQLRGALGFSGGGYTGDGGKYDYAGPAHKGEYIFPQEAVRYYGVDNLARQHRAAISGRGFANGGSTGGSAGSFFGMGGGGGGGTMRLDQFSIEAIADAISERPAVLIADGRQLAQTVSAGNASTSRGI